MRAMRQGRWSAVRLGGICLLVTLFAGALSSAPVAYADASGAPVDGPPQITDVAPPHDATVGTAPGEGDTEGGAAIYRMPFTVPPGRAGMQPEIGLSYNSRAGNGIAGMGWSLSGLSAVHRCPRTLEQDGETRVVSYTANDRLCLDGQRLIRTGGSAYGQSGAIYATEVDQFARVTQYGSLTGSSACFKVERKSGRVQHYGATVTGSSCGSTVHHARMRPDGAPATLSWLIEKEEDRVGNNIFYTYTDYGYGETLITSIQYTGFGSTAGDREVAFTYGARPTSTSASIIDNDVSASYLSGGLTMQTRRLTGIDTYVGSEHVRSWALDYDNPDSARNVSRYSGRSLLQAVTECAYAPSSTCHPATLFSMRDGHPATAGIHYAFEHLPISNLPVSVPVPESGINGTTPPLPETNPGASTFKSVGDLDGDGSREFVALVQEEGSGGTTSPHIYLMKSYANRSFSSAVDVSDLGVGIQPWSYVDFDGDGRAEVVKSILGTGDGFAHLLVWKLPRGGWSTNPSNLFLDVTTDVPHGTTVAGPFSTDYADFDGDGRTDVLVQGPDAACGSDSAGTKVRLRVYLNRINGRLIDGASAHFVAAADNGPLCLARTVYQPSGVIESEVFSRSTDFNGDGTADLFLTYSHGQTTEQRLVSLHPGSSANAVAFDSAPMSSIGLSQDEIDTLDIDRSAMVRWMDINGDGLEDFVFAQTGGSVVPSGQWLVRFNTGGKLSAYIATNATFGLGTYGGNVNPVWGNRYRYDNRIKPFDVDSDGRTELLFPVRIGAMICSYYKVPPPPMGCSEPPAGGGPPEVAGAYPGPCEEVQECPVDPLTGAEIEPSGTRHGRFTIWNLYLPEGHGPARDQSTYVMHPMRFVIGNVSPATGLPSVDVQEVQQDLYGDVGEDVYGDGLGDVVVPIGCGSSPCMIFADGNSTSNRPSQLPDGTLVDSLTEGRKLYINHNYGVADSRAKCTPTDEGVPLPPLAPDLMHAVANGVDDWTAWAYLALGAELPSCFVPLYTLPSVNPYVDERHYYFTSSMPVVQTMTKSSGILVGGGDPTIKNGARTWTYSYQEAMYNHRGRGFQGFRKIIQRQEPAATEADRAIRIETTYHQKFPLTGKVEEVEISDPDHPSTPFRRETTEWRCNLANRNVLCPGDGTNPSAPQPNMVYFPYLDNQIVQNYNLASAEAGGSSLVSTVKTINADTSTATVSGWDAAGNLVHQQVRGGDNGSGGTFVSLYTIDTDRTFVTNTSNWWLDKLTQQVVTSTISYSGTHALPAGASAPTRTVTTAYTWNADRTPDVQTVQPGVPNQQLSTEYGYPTPSYGLPTSISITGLGVSPQPRVTQMNYTKNGTSVAADGYFVLDTTNAMGQMTTTERRPRDGQVSRQIEPSGLSTVSTYDAFGKLTRTDYKDANGAALEPSLYVSWNPCADGGCPGNYYGEGPDEDFAAWRVTKVKNGTPTEVHWYDLLGREVKQAHRGFDGTFIQTRTEYDSLGSVERTSVPHFAGSTPYWTTFNSYDRLGRVTQKTAPGADNFNVVTNYTYTGNETKIKVRASNVSGTGNCPTTTNLCMDMRRYTDVLGRLVKTVQALDGNANYATTRYWYDGPGNPVAAEDAEGNVTRATYDARGRRTQMDDPDAGTWDFTYNGLGELLTQTDARGVVTEHVYDALGRLTQRTATAPGALPNPNLHVLRDSWDWDPLDAPGQLDSQTREWGVSTGSLSDIWSETYDYNSITQRLDNQQTTIGGSLETTSYTYDTYGREQSRTYPSDVAVKSSYAANGELSALGPWPTGASWWTATDKDPWGNVTDETYFGVTTGSHTTSPRTGQYEQKKWTRAGQTIDQWDYEYDTFGNLDFRARTFPGDAWNETFGYDALQRLVSVAQFDPDCGGGGFPMPCVGSIAYRYTASGNIDSKSDYSADAPGVYSYGKNGCGPHFATSIKLNSYSDNGAGDHSYTCDANGNTIGGDTLSGWYDFNNQPWHLTRTGVGTRVAAFRYAPDGKVFLEDASSQTTHFGPRGYEVTTPSLGPLGSTVQRHELGPIVVLRPEIGPTTVHAVLRDRLGSLGTLMTSTGSVNLRRSYDAFGRTRNGGLGGQPHGTLDGLPYTQHGFTDHNHVDDVWLLHMNGRVYDYQLGRFLSPDPLVQFPANSQSLNPYSYILNNPLAGRDPSGYAVKAEGGECTKMTGSNICGQDTGAQNGQTTTSRNLSDTKGNHATITTTRGSNGAVLSQSVTGYGGVKDQAAPGADKGAKMNTGTTNEPDSFVGGVLKRLFDDVIVSGSPLGLAFGIPPYYGGADSPEGQLGYDLGSGVEILAAGPLGILRKPVETAREAVSAARWLVRAGAFEKAGIKTEEHFLQRLTQRGNRGITEQNALDAYRNGRLFYDPQTNNYIRHSSRTGVSVVTDAPNGGRAITVFEGKPSPTWNPVPWRLGQ